LPTFRSLRVYRGLLVALIEILARGGCGALGHAFGTRTVRTAPAAWETLAAAIVALIAAVDLRLRAGDEGGQAIDAAIVSGHRLRLGLRLLWRVLRLRARLAFAMFAWLLVAIALIGLLVVALMIAPAMVAIVAHKGLRLILLRYEAGLLAEIRIVLAVVLAIVAHHVVGARLLLLLRLVLPELLLCGGDQAEIVLGVLVVVLGGDGIARRARVAGKLQIFLGDMRGRAADLDVGTVRFEHPGHRILAAPVVVIVIIVTVTHPLVVLTVSHVLPLIPALSKNEKISRQPRLIRRVLSTPRIEMRLPAMSIASTIAFSKDAFPTRRHLDRRTLHLTCRNKPNSLA